MRAHQHHLGYLYEDMDQLDAASHYDWCFPGQHRTLEEHPYGYDAHYTWREFAKNKMTGIEGLYSDRMRDWDPEKYTAAAKASGGGFIEHISQDQAKTFIETYYDGTKECVGFARCCNVASGYGIGIFFVRDKS